MLKTITSIYDYDKYFPISYGQDFEKRFFREATPEEIGKYLAKKSIDKIRMYFGK